MSAYYHMWSIVFNFFELGVYLTVSHHHTIKNYIKRLIMQRQCRPFGDPYWLNQSRAKFNNEAELLEFDLTEKSRTSFKIMNILQLAS